MDKNLLSQLQTGKTSQRRAAAYKIGRSKETRYVPYLINAYKDTDMVVRQNIIEALRLLLTDQAKEFLRADEAGRISIIQQMNEGSPEKKFDHELSVADKVLVYELRSGNLKERRAAAYKMGKSNDPVFVHDLICAYCDNDPTVRQNVIDALRILSSDQANEFVRSSEAKRMEICARMNEISPEKKFINELMVDKHGLLTFKERMQNSTPEEQGVLIGELSKMFGKKAVEWWEAIAVDVENHGSRNLAKVMIPAPPPGNLGSRLLLTTAAIAIAGDVIDGVVAASDRPNLLLNETINVPSVCNLCGVYESTLSIPITTEVDFSQFGAALGGPALGRSKVELRTPICYYCRGLEGLLPGVNIEKYEKINKEWTLLLSFTNHAIANLYLELNHGRIPEPLQPHLPAPVESQDFLQESKGGQSVSILVHWPGVEVVKDQSLSIYIDELLAGTGSFVKGFDLKIRTGAGVHKISTSALSGIRKPAVVTFKSEEDKHYRVEVSYSRAWGNLSLSCVEVK